MIKNTFTEFVIKLHETEGKSYRYLDITKRPYYELNELRVRERLILSNCYESNIRNKSSLIIVEGRFDYCFNLGCHSINNKKTFVIFRNKSVVGLIESYTQDCLDCFHVFVKAMSDEELRLALELALPKKLGVEVITLRDEMISVISSNPSPSFHRQYFDYKPLGV